MKNNLDLPVLAPKELLEKRGAYKHVSDIDTAIICFRGHKASTQLAHRFSCKPIKEA